MADFETGSVRGGFFSEPHLLTASTEPFARFNVNGGRASTRAKEPRITPLHAASLREEGVSAGLLPKWGDEETAVESKSGPRIPLI